MTDLTGNDLKELAKRLSLSTKVYSNTLSQLINRPYNINTISRAITKQIDMESSLFSSTSNILKKINSLAISPRTQSLLSANSDLTKLAQKLLLPESTLMKIFESQKRIQDRIQQISNTNKNLAQAFARIDTTRILAAALTTQAKLANIDKLYLGKIAGIDSILSKQLSINLGNLTSSYQSLIDISTKNSSFAKYLPLVTTYPPVDYYREIDLLETITTERASKDKVDQLIDREIGESLPSVDDLLKDLNPSFCPLLEGARQSLRTDNPERARHVTTSLRELFTHVLHELAPDKDILKWTTDSAHFHDNRPTRKARLLYICRDINFNQLTSFVENDVKSALSFIDSLNSGTHVIDSKLTNIQLSSMIARMESLLIFLLQINNYH